MPRRQSEEGRRDKKGKGESESEQKAQEGDENTEGVNESELSSRDGRTEVGAGDGVKLGGTVTMERREKREEGKIKGACGPKKEEAEEEEEEEEVEEEDFLQVLKLTKMS